VIADGPLVEVQEADSGVAQAETGETGTTWREALSARLRPADHRISDEQIFAILNGGDDGHTAAELCAASGVTVPMYCVWKSKYRQLGLDELRQARRREQRRRYTVIGSILVTATLLIGAIVVGLGWAVFSTFTRPTASPSATVTSAPDRQPSRATAVPEPRPVSQRVTEQPATKIATVDRRSPSDAEAATAETGYRIQITAAETEQQGRGVVAQLVSRGYSAYMRHAVVGNKDVFRVRVGPFETLQEAEETAAQLRSAGYAGVWIAR
jgi:cell division septation protein DedD